MKPSKLTMVLVAFTAVVALSGCANTIRGFGQDAANTVNATEAAGQTVVNAAD